VKLDEAKIKKEIARVNMIDVLEFRLRWPSRFLLMTSFKTLSRLQHDLINAHKRNFSTNSKIKTDIKVSPIIIITRSVSKMNRNHSVF